MTKKCECSPYPCRCPHMPAHTPGPWFVDMDVPSQVKQPLGSKRRRIVCPPDANGIADARLIAAAPDLLAALYLMMGDDPSTQDWDAALAAFAKAGGQL